MSDSGNPNLYRKLAKLTAPGEWVQVTEAMEIPGVGCHVIRTTRMTVSGAIVESSEYVPGVKIGERDGFPALVAI